VATWKDTTLKLLEEKVANEDYEFFHDENILQLCANVVKTYSPKGQTPIFGSVDTKGYQYVCLANKYQPRRAIIFPNQR
jgi:hypothetical protein